MSRTPRIAAHRGWSAAFPENTLPAFLGAARAGADDAEMDLRLTRDGVAVISHDPDLRRLGGRDLAIADADWDDLRRIPLHHGATVPDLARVLEVLPPEMGILFDVKIDGAAVIARAVEALAASGHAAHFGVRHASQIPLTGDHPVIAFPKTPEMRAAFLNAGVKALRIWEGDLDRPENAELLASGLDIWVTAGRTMPDEIPGYITPTRLRRLLTMGISGILMNDPALVEND